MQISATGHPFDLGSSLCCERLLNGQEIAQLPSRATKPSGLSGNGIPRSTLKGFGKPLKAVR